MLRPKFKNRTRTIAGDENANNHDPLPGNDPFVGTIIITDGHGPFLQLMSGNIGGLDKDSGIVADSEDAVTNVSISEALEPLTTIWDCPKMNLASCEVTDGVFVSGWTCGHCPCPPRDAAKFFKHQNATKALHHVIKNPGQNIKLCKGNIPFQKKQQYKALYNLGIMRKRIGKGEAKKCVRILTNIKTGL